MMEHSYQLLKQVRWDEDLMCNNEERISPWEIEHSVSLPPPLSIQSSPRIKKLRTTLHETDPENHNTGTFSHS